MKLEVSKAIRNFDDHRTRVSDDLLKDALDLYELGLDSVVKNPPRDINSNIPGLEEMNIAYSIINTYYRQNPDFDYNFTRKGFTPEQMNTLQDYQNDKRTQERLRKKRELRGYDY